MRDRDMEVIGDMINRAMSLWNSAVADIKYGYLKAGQAIHMIKSEKLWRMTGSHVLSFRHFCDKELHISVAQANRLELIYRKLGKILPDIPIDISKVTLMLPYIEGKTDDEKYDILNGIKDLSVEDVKNTIKDMIGKGDKATDVCMHGGELETWNRCKNCGKFFK